MMIRTSEEYCRLELKGPAEAVAHSGSFSYSFSSISKSEFCASFVYVWPVLCDSVCAFVCLFAFVCAWQG